MGDQVREQKVLQIYRLSHCPPLHRRGSLDNTKEGESKQHQERIWLLKISDTLLVMQVRTVSREQLRALRDAVHDVSATAP